MQAPSTRLALRARETFARGTAKLRKRVRRILHEAAIVLLNRCPASIGLAKETPCADPSFWSISGLLREVMPPTYAIFCADPLNPRSVEPDFADEAIAAQDAGFTVVRVDHDDLDRRIDARAALRKTKFGASGLAVYRGWMMSVAAYQALYLELKSADVTLLTTPQEYEACHHAPGSYSALMEWMPKTVWLDKLHIDDRDALLSAIKPFESRALILKDWVKSQASGYWAEACFIPDASDHDAVMRVVERFRELQGDSLAGGFVFKEYVSLMPRQAPAYEHRAFIFRGRVLGCWPRSEGACELGRPPVNLLNDVASKVPSPFASADFGCDTEGQWWLLEVGDGQVSGLPKAAAATGIFKAMVSGLGADRHLRPSAHGGPSLPLLDLSPKPPRYRVGR